MTERTRNLSRNGMYFISLPGNYYRGLRVSIELNEQNGLNGHWRMPGRIAHVTELPNSHYGIGVEFLHKYKPRILVAANSFGDEPARKKSC
jgi:hypothetical protein